MVGYILIPLYTHLFVLLMEFWKLVAQMSACELCFVKSGEIYLLAGGISEWIRFHGFDKHSHEQKTPIELMCFL
ncbi:hypothetical protein Pan161_21210 [Gimesia algae]|uniref:Uncharacterized protein n=1 Tax=Gimesia algae TaxID=2527971 RepID=A0A517VBV7_9PLAN|nr:hypothetical protein Pan161_21210 [Gimesia algae]